MATSSPAAAAAAGDASAVAPGSTSSVDSGAADFFSVGRTIGVAQPAWQRQWGVQKHSVFDLKGGRCVALFLLSYHRLFYCIIASTTRKP